MKITHDNPGTTLTREVEHCQSSLRIEEKLDQIICIMSEIVRILKPVGRVEVPEWFAANHEGEKFEIVRPEEKKKPGRKPKAKK